MRMQVKLLARKMLVASVLLLLNGCQTAPLKLEDVVSKVTGESSKQAPEVSDEEYIEAEYTVFYDQGDHLKELVGKGAYSAALKLFNAHYDFFLDNSAFTGKSRIDQYDLQLSKVAQYLNQEVYGSKVAAVRDRKSVV